MQLCTHEILLIFPYAGSTSECPGELVFISSQLMSLLEDTFFLCSSICDQI